MIFHKKETEKIKSAEQGKGRDLAEVSQSGPWDFQLEATDWQKTLLESMPVGPFRL